jgi:hypothetical protein
MVGIINLLMSFFLPTFSIGTVTGLFRQPNNFALSPNHYRLLMAFNRFTDSFIDGIVNGFACFK